MFTTVCLVLWFNVSMAQDELSQTAKSSKGNKAKATDTLSVNYVVKKLKEEGNRRIQEAKQKAKEKIAKAKAETNQRIALAKERAKLEIEKAKLKITKELQHEIANEKKALENTIREANKEVEKVKEEVLKELQDKIGTRQPKAKTKKRAKKN